MCACRQGAEAVGLRLEPAVASAQDSKVVARTPRPGRKLLAIELPQLRGHVNDHAKLLSPDEARSLQTKLKAHESSTGQQLVLLTVERLPTPDLENFSYTVANRAKLGRACYDDGILFLIALADRKLRIEVGYGLEPAVPDAAAAEVIKEVGPLLAKKQYAAAVNTAFDRLIAAASAVPAERTPGCTAR